MVSITEKVKATLKSQDTEGWFEIHFTRTPGYLCALFFKHLHIHPIAVTLMSIVIGAASGWCFYFDDLLTKACVKFTCIPSGALQLSGQGEGLPLLPKGYAQA